MNPEISRLKQKQEEELVHDTASVARAESGTQFESVEELLRHDSAQNLVPPKVGEHVKNSIAAEPRTAKSWWEKLFS